MMKVLMFGTTTDRQIVAKPNKNDGFDMVFQTRDEEHTGCITEFTIDRTRWHLSLTKDDSVYYCAIPPGTTIEQKKLKPAVMIRDADEAARMRIGMFTDDDDKPGSESDYNLLSADGTLALVDHPKFNKCGIGIASYASAFYCSDVENQDKVVAPPPPPNIGEVAQKVYVGVKNKTEWLSQTADAAGLTDHEREMFMKPTFEADVNRAAIVFLPETQAQVHTASQLLLRVPDTAVNPEHVQKYAGALGVDPEQLGMTGDSGYSTAVLGRASATGRSLCIYGEDTNCARLLIATALTLSRPPSVVMDLVALGFSVHDMQAIMKACPDKEFTVVVPRSKEHNKIAEEIGDLDGSVEVCRTKMQQACLSRCKNQIEFCAVSNARADPAFGKCPDAWQRLLSPIFCTAMLHHQTWMPVNVQSQA